MGVIGVFVGMSKNFWALRVFFLQIKKSQVANCTRSPYFTLLPYVRNGCLDLFMISMNLNYIAILNINNPSYLFIIRGISRSENVNLLEKVNLTEKSRTL